MYGEESKKKTGSAWKADLLAIRMPLLTKLPKGARFLSLRKAKYPLRNFLLKQHSKKF